MSAKFPTCDVAISMSRFISRKDKYRHEARAVNKNLKEMCTN